MKKRAILLRPGFPGFLLLVTLMLAGCPSGKGDKNTDLQELPTIGRYHVPDPLVGLGGEKVRDAGDWNSWRRQEVLELFEELVYGRVPDVDPGIEFELIQETEGAMDGRARMKELKMKVGHAGKSLEALLLIYLPAQHEGPAPLFMTLNFYGNHTIHPDPAITVTRSWTRNNEEYGITNHQTSEQSRGFRQNKWAVDKILARGYGLATMYYGDIDPDFHDEFQNGIHGLMDVAPRDSASWGSIAAWAWGLSRSMDYFETDPDIDHERVAVMGHSRLGKTSLWAGATDERFALVISNNSGCGGAALSRRKSGETVEAINRRFPHWFAMHFHAYNEREEDLPVDQHMLLSLVAPRPLYVASAAEDAWADPRGEYLSLYHAGRVYELFGHDVPADTTFPSIDQPLWKGKLGYHVRSGGHDVTDYDWQQYLDFADQQMNQ